MTAMVSAGSCQRDDLREEAARGDVPGEHVQPNALAGMRAAYRAAGWCAAEGAIPESLAGPARVLADDLARRHLRQDRLSGVHNPFGHHACPNEAWRFLDLAESTPLLDLVENVLGPDIVLWDSELLVDPQAWPRDEARCWPADPLAGTVAAIDLASRRVVLIDITLLAGVLDGIVLPPGPCYVLRYMPATSHYNRDPRFEPNRLATELRPLVNHCIRPIWLVRGEDRANSDFASGFAPPAARWADALRLPPAP